MKNEKNLILLRHGEAEAGIGYHGDYKRSLTETGVFKLNRLNKVLEKKGVQFDLLIKSPALRAMETAELISNNLAVKHVKIEEAIYESSVDALLEILCKLPRDIESVLLIGHNPSLSSLLVYLTDDFNLSLLPGMMAIVTFDFPEWGMLTKGSGCLLEVLQ